MALNSTLPEDISIISVEEMTDDFHAQYSCKSKIYLYRILNRDYPSALLRNKAWYLPKKLKLTKIREACRLLVGEHDFSAFAKSDLTVKTTVRNVKDVKLKKTKDGIIEFEIEADGFLKRMVRLIVGTLVEVGREKITPGEFKDILDSGIKTQNVVAAPASGLFLKKVIY